MGPTGPIWTPGPLSGHLSPEAKLFVCMLDDEYQAHNVFTNALHWILCDFVFIYIYWINGPFWDQ